MEERNRKKSIDLENAPMRIVEAIHYLIKQGNYKNQEEIANEIGCTPSNLSGFKKGRDGVLTENMLVRFAQTFRSTINKDWVLFGDGEMIIKSADDIQKASTVVNQAWANNSPNAMVNAAYNGNITVADSEKTNQNIYGDRPEDERRWCPVVPASMAKQGNFDIMGHISKQMGGTFERLYSGTACLDIWHYVTDNDLYPFYQKGDCLGLKAYEPGDHRIKTGNVYVIDTKRDGLITRRFRLDENKDFVSYTFNESDPQIFVIPKEDVIRVFSVVLMFRY
ncbi:MAG: hypothetical protein SOW57_03140 [Prevotella sp.]|nr:hypothetical protein [Prevotella sp.]